MIQLFSTWLHTGVIINYTPLIITLYRVPMSDDVITNDIISGGQFSSIAIQRGVALS